MFRTKCSNKDCLSDVNIYSKHPRFFIILKGDLYFTFLKQSFITAKDVFDYNMLPNSLSKQLILEYLENLTLVSSICKDAGCKSSTSMKTSYAKDFLKLLKNNTLGMFLRAWNLLKTNI